MVKLVGKVEEGYEVQKRRIGCYLAEIGRIEDMLIERGADTKDISNKIYRAMNDSDILGVARKERNVNLLRELADYLEGVCDGLFMEKELVNLGSLRGAY